MIRLFIADDHAIFREGLKQILAEQPDFEIVGEATTGDGLVERLGALGCDVVLLDLSMPGRSGIALVRDVAAARSVHIVVLSMHDERQYVIEALKAGADGYVTKPFEADALVKAVKAVLGLLPPPPPKKK